MEKFNEFQNSQEVIDSIISTTNLTVTCNYKRSCTLNDLIVKLTEYFPREFANSAAMTGLTGSYVSLARSDSTSFSRMDYS